MCPRFCLKDTLLRDLLNGNEVDAMLLIAHTIVEFCSSEAAFTVVPAWSSPLMSVERQIMGLLFGWSCMVLEQESANFFSRRLVCKYVWLWGPCVATTQLCHCSMRNWHIRYLNEWACFLIKSYLQKFGSWAIVCWPRVLEQYLWWWWFYYCLLAFLLQYPCMLSRFSHVWLFVTV